MEELISPAATTAISGYCPMAETERKMPNGEVIAARQPMVALTPAIKLKRASDDDTRRNLSSL